MPYLRAYPVAGTEGSGTLSFVVALDAPSINEVRVNYGFDNGTANYGGYTPDFVTQNATLTFAPGETRKTVSVALTNDTTAEPTEVFWLDLNTPVNATVMQRWTPAFIFDDDGTAGAPLIAVSQPVVDESARTANFFVWLSRPSTLPVSVGYATADETASAGQDYTQTAGLLSFAPGEIVKTVTVDLIDDHLAETQEFLRLQLNAPSGATLAQPYARAEIGANDGATVGAPYISARTLAVGEGEPGLQFVVTLSAPSSNEVRVNFGVDNGTAVYGGYTPDFQTYSGTLVFAPGETTKTLPYNLIDDTTTEAAEVAWLDLNSPVNGTVVQRWTPAFIFDDDASTGTPAIAISAPVVDESARTASFFVWLSRPSSDLVTVDYATADDTAQAGADYRALSGRLSFQPGEVVKTVLVDIVDDGAAEAAEFFKLQLSAPSGATLAQEFGRAEIGASDGSQLGQPYVTARTVGAGEGDGTLTAVVSLSAPSPNEVRVNFGFDNGTAVYGGYTPDFQTYSGTLVFAPGQTTKTLNVNLDDDTAAESREVFWLDLNTPVNAVIGQRWTPVVLVDNDAATGTPSVSVSDVVIDEAGRTAAFFVSLAQPSSSVVSVSYATADDTARAGSDYRAASGTLSFQPGQTLKTVLIDVIDDALTESDEFFQLLLSSPDGATLGDAIGAALIGRSDGSAVSRPLISARPVVVSEGDGRTDFAVQLAAPSTNEVRVNFGFDNGTAVYGGYTPDFDTYSGTLIFAPGETTKRLSNLLVDDTSSESDESYTLDMNTPVNAAVAQRYSAVTIIDNDGASRVLSHGISNDRYLVTGALDRIAESPGGGIDTVISSISYTLPDQVENLVLTGGALNALGNDGNNVLRGTAANNLFDGKGGADTVVFSGPAAAYTIAGGDVSRTVSSAADGSDTLLGVERLQFSDLVMARDTSPGGNTYLTYAMLNAAFNAAPDTALLSRWTAQLDRVGSLSALAQAMINEYAPGVSDEVLVAHLWATIVGTPIPLDALGAYVGLVRDGTYTQAGLVEMVTTLDLNTVEIVGIVGQTLMLDPAYFPVPAG